MDEPELRRAHFVQEALAKDVLIGEPVLATPLLEQNELWQTRDGRVLYMHEMEPNHRRNLLAWLERNAFGLMLRHDSEWFSCGLAPRGEMAQDGLMSALLEEAERDPLERLKETPFYKRLAWFVAQDKCEHVDCDNAATRTVVLAAGDGEADSITARACDQHKAKDPSPNLDLDP